MTMNYTAPVQDWLFNLEHVADLAAIVRLPAFDGLDLGEGSGLETARDVVQACARFAENVLAPLNTQGDRHPPTCVDGVVTATRGFRQAWQQYAAGGWQGLQHPPEYGGQGLPRVMGAACTEIINSANLSFALCPLLTDGAIEALLTAASEALKHTYLEKLVTGQWAGTMNLTEPQAGSDLAQIRTRAQAQADGSYRIAGSKIFITWGEHDLTENIVHLVLARVDGAPEGIKGISLFVVPKYLVQADGKGGLTIGPRNDVTCVSLERKLGIHASPTAVMQYGGQGAGAVGWLVGEENRGLETMFVMMNAERYGVGVQGVAVAERSTHQAVQYAHGRVQSRPVDGSQPHSVAIIHHPDVRRMLMRMRALTQGGRALAAFAAAACDHARHQADAAQRAQYAALYEYLVPLVKGWCTEAAQEVVHLGVQVHGGMGFIEETGAAQYLRDARILTIYEGTTAIQANDLVGRKTVRNQGQTARALAAQIAQTEVALHACPHPGAGAVAAVVARHLGAARQDFAAVVDFVLAHAQSNPNAVFAGSVPYLMLAGNLVAGWQLARSLLAAQGMLAESGTGHDTRYDVRFLQAKTTTAVFYAEHILVQTQALRDAILHGANSVTALPPDDF